MRSLSITSRLVASAVCRSRNVHDSCSTSASVIVSLGERVCGVSRCVVVRRGVCVVCVCVRYCSRGAWGGGSGSPKSIRKQVSKVVPVDAVVEDVFGHDYASQGLKCYTPGAGLYIPELVYELPLKEEKDSTQEMATESDKKALVFCDLVTNVAEGPFNVRILGIVTGGNNPVVPWMPRYFFVRDKAQTKRFLEALGRRDDIGLLVMAHGEPVKCGPDEMKRHLANLAAQF
ncbi:uncharacterized protein ACA1_266250 [Acanthamoeba castellanii str. Neff]|uniref:Uncharacterized protein n=1 Tax=Acanthamoeba castellanii (strain ATCC 30010 / Neff) TaxID=1257118 RepID=L8H1K6_ACACF|nr:uncharacterized protein ACA1_266250 [Acanthamoeba castellanii str. Neff]ELR19399.1 hypothetical protein ACA1_266250 [Acanthamoeba castellanii str. Neff]